MQCCTSVSRPVFTARCTPRTQQQAARRCGTVTAAWNPGMPDHGMGRHRQPEPPERYRSLFAAEWIPASSNPQTVWDARDALEACSGLWGDERSECLSVFGLDAGQVDAFYSTVLTLELALEQDTDPEEEASHQGKERC